VVVVEVVAEDLVPIEVMVVLEGVGKAVLRTAKMEL
jgi:hypothetical protein